MHSRRRSSTPMPVALDEKAKRKYNLVNCIDNKNVAYQLALILELQLQPLLQPWPLHYCEHRLPVAASVGSIASSQTLLYTSEGKFCELHLQENDLLHGPSSSFEETLSDPTSS